MPSRTPRASTCLGPFPRELTTPSRSSVSAAGGKRRRCAWPSSSGKLAPQPREAEEEEAGPRL
eukprot:6961321-Pyramimonas_sp.AAC.1